MKVYIRTLAQTLALAVVLLAGASPAQAGEQRVTLGLDLWCPSCAYIAKRTLERVDGVQDVEILPQSQTAIVAYDDGRTNIAALTQAMAAVGMRSEVVAE